MSAITDLIDSILRDNTNILVALLVFLAAGTLAFSIMAVVRVRGAVKNRTTRIVMDERERVENAKRSLRYSSVKAVTQLIEYTTKHYASTSGDAMKVLRTRLIQAGIYDPSAVAMFFVGRALLAVLIAGALFFFCRTSCRAALRCSGSSSWAAAWPAMSAPASTSTSASRRAGSSTAPAFPTSWICWWCARIPACRWKLRSSGSGARWAAATPRSPPTSI